MPRHFISVLFLLSSLATAQQNLTQTSKPKLPYSPSLNLADMDRSVDPCADFYTYSCGGWMKNNPIPADQSSWAVYSKVTRIIWIFLRAILEQAATEKNRDAVTQKIGDYYGACMDEAKVESLGAKPLQPDLQPPSLAEHQGPCAAHREATAHRSRRALQFRPRTGPGQLRFHAGRPSRRAVWDFPTATTT